MYRLMIPVFLALPVLVCASGCRQSANEEHLPGAAPPGQPAVLKVPESDVVKLNPRLLPAHKLDKDKKSNAMVGGCGDYCEDPKNAFRNFVRTLLRQADEGSPEFARFIDTTTLVDNGEEHGKQWAAFWMDAKHDERNREIARWMKAYGERVGSAASRAELEGSLASGMEFRRISSTLVEITFVPPDRTGSSNSEHWRVQLGLRGLEWLVCRIYD